MTDLVAERHNEGKAELSQLLWFRLEFLAEVCRVGRLKYPDVFNGKAMVPNWTLGGKPDEEYLDACMRHIKKHVEGHFRDEETGCAHLAHAWWNLGACLTNNYGTLEPLVEKDVIDDGPDASELCDK